MEIAPAPFEAPVSAIVFHIGGLCRAPWNTSDSSGQAVQQTWIVPVDFLAWYPSDEHTLVSHDSLEQRTIQHSVRSRESAMSAIDAFVWWSRASPQLAYGML